MVSEYAPDEVDLFHRWLGSGFEMKSVLTQAACQFNDSSPAWASGLAGVCPPTLEWGRSCSWL
ncbi:MAG: hypothetical protein ACU4EQ_00600 [Candidatus Nitrosoglobus sp.]